MKSEYNFGNMQGLVELFRLEMELQRLKLQNQYQQALQVYDCIIQIKQQSPNKLGLAKTLVEKAYILEEMGYTQNALVEYKRAQEIVNSTTNSMFQEQISTNINRLQTNILQLNNIAFYSHDSMNNFQ